MYEKKCIQFPKETIKLYFNYKLLKLTLTEKQFCKFKSKEKSFLILNRKYSERSEVLTEISNRLLLKN